MDSVADALFSRDSRGRYLQYSIGRYTFGAALRPVPRSFDISPTAFDYISARQLIRRFAQYGRARTRGW